MEQTFLSVTSLRETILMVGGAAFVTAMIVGSIFTFCMYRLSWRFGVLDRPDGFLKCHKQPVATLGGIPLFLTLTLTTGVVLLALRHITAFSGISAEWEKHLSIIAMFVAGLIILLLGVCDDLHHIFPRTKILFQTIAAIVLISSGLVIHNCNFFGVFGFSFGILAVPFTLFWLVGSCNAFNFIDGMDGLASGIGAITAMVLGILGLLSGAYAESIISLSLAGALLAILFFNVRPAKIFLGDSGSQLVGLLLGALTIKICTINGAFALPSAGLILSIPVLDTFLSVIRRFSTSEPLAQGDRRHVHHCLKHHGLSIPQVVMILWSAVLIVGVIGVIFCFAGGVISGVLTLAVVVVELYVGVRLGCIDVTELLGRVGLPGWLAEAPEQQHATTSRSIAELEVLWERMKPLFEQVRLDRAILTLEGVNQDGQPNYETYQWVRSEDMIADLLASRWTKRFSLGGNNNGHNSKIVTLQLESAKQLNKNEQRIEWLLKQIRENMERVGQFERENERSAKEKEQPEEIKEYVAL